MQRQIDLSNNGSENPAEKTALHAMQGGGFTGELIRNYDWSKTSLGPSDKWPQSLQSALGICINSNFPIAIYWGPDLVLLYNDAWSAIPGNKHPWALGKPAIEVWPEIWDDIEPQFQKAFSGIPGGSRDALLPMLRHGYTEECYFDFTFTPIYGESGKVDGIFNAVIETTYRVINERRANLLQKLSDSVNAVTTKEEVLLRTSRILDNAPVDLPFYYIHHFDQGSDFTLTASSNNIDVASWPMVETPNNILHIEDLSKVGIPAPVNYWPEAPTEAVISPLKGTDGTLLGYIVAGLSARRKYDKDYKSFFESLAAIISGELNTIKALEDQTRKAEALQQIDKAKTVFFSNISHEFRTPLTLMLSPLESVLESATYLNEKHRNDLETSQRNTYRLQKLVNTLLDFSSIEAGKLAGNFELVDLGKLTRDLASSFRSAIESTGISYQVEVGAIHSDVAVDIDMWEKIVLNLISNAFKYTRAGEISVRIYESNANIILEVRDTGIGIPAESLDKIFERFYRANNPGGRSQEGTGIGLSMVKELVHLHHGDIRVESIPEVGSTFTVTIPSVGRRETIKTSNRAENHTINKANVAFIDEASKWSDVQQVKTEKKIDPENDVKDQPKVLLADDNADMRDYMQRLLSSDCEVRTVSNGEDAFQLSLEWTPELIVTDIMMPQLDGFGLLAKLKSNLTTRNIPVIFLSARAGEEAKLEGIHAGADDYLVKPFSAKELVARVQNQILISRVRRETEKQFYNLFLQSPAHIHVMKGPEHVLEFFHPLGRPFVGGRDLTGMKIREALPELEGQGFFELLDQVFHEGKSVFLPESKASFPRPDGTNQEYFFNITYLPWRDVLGKIQGVLQFTFDVTEQAKASQKLRESEERFRLLATSIPQIVWITDAAGQIEYLSDQWEEFTGQPAADGLQHFQEYIHEADREQVVFDWTESMKNKTPWNAEYRLRNKNGEFQWFSAYTVPWQDTNGVIQKWIGSATNIHTQKSITEELEVVVATRTQQLLSLNTLLQSRNEELTHARSFLQTVLDSSIELVTAFDPDLNYTFVNKRVQDLAHRDPEDLIGKNILEVDPVFEGTDGYQYLQRALKGEVIHLDNRRPFIDDKLVLETFVTPLTINGSIIGVLTMHRDITALVKLTEDLKTSNQELSRSNEDLQQFAHVTSHDLKEPVRKIKMYENLLRTQYKDSLPEKGLTYLDKIEHAAGRISAMIEGVLQYSSVDAVKDTFETIDLNELLRNITEDLEVPVRESDATFVIETLPTVSGSYTLLYQLFYNIVKNSLKFVRKEEAPRIDINDKTALLDEELKHFIRIDITDNGIGFDQGYADRIFESFIRLNPKDKFEGTGLGLALSKKIAERHNGFIVAKSEVNKGATFSVYLPALQK